MIYLLSCSEVHGNTYNAHYGKNNIKTPECRDIGICSFCNKKVFDPKSNKE